MKARKKGLIRKRRAWRGRALIWRRWGRAVFVGGRFAKKDVTGPAEYTWKDME